MTFIVSFGKYGGFYAYNDSVVRVCLGWVAFTWFPFDIDLMLRQLFCDD